MANHAPPPPAAIEAQKAFDAADAEVHRIADSLPSSIAIATGEAVVSEEQSAELQAARDARLAALHALLAVKRWEGDGGPKAAEAALRKAARASGPSDHA